MCMYKVWCECETEPVCTHNCKNCIFWNKKDEDEEE